MKLVKYLTYFVYGIYGIEKGRLEEGLAEHQVHTGTIPHDLTYYFGPPSLF